LVLPIFRWIEATAAGAGRAKKVVPDAPLTVRVKAPAAAGQKAFVTLSAVDVGILTPRVRGTYRTPTFGKQRYGAGQYDVDGRLIEKRPAKGRLKFGGDTGPKATKSLPKKVRLVDVSSGP